MYISKEGFIKSSIKDKILGSINAHGYIVVSLNDSNNTRVLVHRIIMEYILNRKLKKDELIDHIDTNRLNNSFENLRLTDSKGNRNNVLTREKLSIRVHVTNLFGDLILRNAKSIDAYKFLFNKKPNVNGFITSLIKNTIVVNSKYLVFYNNFDINEFFRKLDNILFVVDINKSTILGAFTTLKDMTRGNTKVIESVKYSSLVYYYRHCKNRLIIPFKNYFILKGLEAKDILIANGHLNILKELQTDKDTINKD